MATASCMKLFNRALPGTDYADYRALLSLAVEKGYVVHQRCCTESVHAFLVDKPSKRDFTATFYKTWEQVRTMSRFDQFCDQIFYYFTRINPYETTTTTQSGQQDVEVVDMELPSVLFAQLKPILPIETQEAGAKCRSMLESGVALSGDTIKCVFDVLDKCGPECGLASLRLEAIKNREALMIAYERLKRVPSDASEFVRFLAYRATGGDTLLIKSREALDKIVRSGYDASDDLSAFTGGLVRLAPLYGRYKLIWLALKHANKKNVPFINKLSKLSKPKSHKKSATVVEAEAAAASSAEVTANEEKPAAQGNFFQTLLLADPQRPFDKARLVRQLGALNNFKKIALLETIQLYLLQMRQEANEAYRVFSIRNGKIWVKLSKNDQAAADIAQQKRIETIAEMRKRHTRRTTTTTADRSSSTSTNRDEPKQTVVSFPLPFKKYKTSKRGMAAKDATQLDEIYAIVYESLVASLRTKLAANAEHGPLSEQQYALPAACTLTAPRSEKAFVSEYPFGSSLSLDTTDAVLGISWTKEDRAADLDLSLMSLSGQKIGWNSEFSGDASRVLFSGDVVEAPGTELIYAAQGFDMSAGVYVNLYRRNDDDDDAYLCQEANEQKSEATKPPVTFKFYVAREAIKEDKMTRNYMIEPSSVSFATKMTMESSEMLMGFVSKGRFVFSTFRASDKRVSTRNASSTKMIEFNLATQQCHLDLRKLLADVGLTESSDVKATTDAVSSSSIPKEKKKAKVHTFDSKANIIQFFA